MYVPACCFRQRTYMLMGYSMRLELTRVWGLNDFQLVMGLYRGHPLFYLSTYFYPSLIFDMLLSLCMRVCKQLFFLCVCVWVRVLEIFVCLCMCASMVWNLLVTFFSNNFPLCIYIHIYVCSCIYIYVCVCVCVCVFEFEYFSLIFFFFCLFLFLFLFSKNVSEFITLGVFFKVLFSINSRLNFLSVV